jgi:hypothetical protein
MLSLFLWAQIAAATPAQRPNYSTRALRDLVAAAALANREPPEALRAYRSHIETETSLLIRDTLGREHTAEVEQMATQAEWTREGHYDLHIVGYRSQSVGVPYSTLSIVRAWTVPSLYGERLSMGVYFAPSRRRSDTLTAVHPFATDRDEFYRFEGGDTVATLHSATRTIPIVRIRVHPTFHGLTKLAAFDGEIDLDADRKQVVRMRGQFVTIGGAPTKRERLSRSIGVVAVAYIEFVNAEVRGKYWLPAFQRTEFQASFPALGSNRPVFRIVSTISDIVVADTGARIVGASDSTDHLRVNVSWAPGDSVSAFGDWRRELGMQSASVHSDDFVDMAPDAWRPDGPPRLDMFPNRTSKMFRFNRVEGLYLGLAPSVDFRSKAPGVSAGAYGGWAFAEATARGGAYVKYQRNQNILGVRGERALASTNDFGIPLDDDPGIGALLGSIDNYDYVDRWTAMLSATRVLGAVDVGLLTVQLGGGTDHPEHARISRGIFTTGTGFLPNRGIAPGSYGLASADLELHPNVSGDYVQPGFGAHAHYEAARGDLNWERAELGVSARQYWGPISVAAHADGGMLFGAVQPPQKLFELGGNGLLPGYDYKQFAGDRALLFRTFASYRFGVFKRPIAFIRNYYIPGLSPGLAVSAQGGWTEISSAAAAASVRELGVVDGAPVSTATNGVRATVGGGITLFSDLLHLGMARPVDHAAPWRFVIGFGATF